jgi:predicted RNA-binding protein with EMAP domain
MAGIDSDSRLIIAEGMVKQFTDLVQNRKIPLTLNRQKILTRLSEINSKLKALKWSYKPLEQVLHSKELRDIEINAKEIFDSFPEKWEDRLSSQGFEGKNSVAVLTYIKNFFYSMRERITKGFSDDFADAIEILCGEIIGIETIDSSNWKCIVTDGQARYHVVTNIPDIKKGEIVPIAKLPPQVVHGILSEGMFAGSSKGLQRFSKEEVGKRPDLSDKELGQSRGILENLYVGKK